MSALGFSRTAGSRKNLDPTVQDIYYTERVVWLDTTLGTFYGGRT